MSGAIVNEFPNSSPVTMSLFFVHASRRDFFAPRLLCGVAAIGASSLHFNYGCEVTTRNRALDFQCTFTVIIIWFYLFRVKMSSSRFASLSYVAFCMNMKTMKCFFIKPMNSSGYCHWSICNSLSNL